MNDLYRLFGNLDAQPSGMRLSVCANDWCRISYGESDELLGIDRFTNIADTLRLFLEDPNDPLFGTDPADDSSWRQLLSNRDVHSDSTLELDGRSRGAGFDFRLRGGENKSVLSDFRLAKEQVPQWLRVLDALKTDYAALLWRQKFSLLFMPGAGKWADLTLRVEDEGCNVGVSTSDHDVLSEICNAVIKVAKDGGLAKTNWWSLEPYIVQFAIKSADKDTANVVLTWFDDLVNLSIPVDRELEETIFVGSIRLKTLAHELIDQCRLIISEFGEDVYNKRVGHSFPRTLVEQLQGI